MTVHMPDILSHWACAILTVEPWSKHLKEGAYTLNPTAKCMAAKSEGNTVGRGSQSPQRPHHGGSNTSKGQDYRQEGERLRKSLLCP